MGMESEWSADLRITGTTADPRITGSLDLLRGTYGFAGRRFTLDEGEIDFTGGEINNPVISIQASTSVENVNAILNISGRAQQVSRGSLRSVADQLELGHHSANPEIGRAHV